MRRNSGATPAPPIHTHDMPEWWEAPERFEPERFAPGRAEHEHHTHSWIPFGGGTHMCIGPRFAEAQVRPSPTRWCAAHLQTVWKEGVRAELRRSGFSRGVQRHA